MYILLFFLYSFLTSSFIYTTEKYPNIAEKAWNQFYENNTFPLYTNRNLLEEIRNVGITHRMTLQNNLTSWQTAHRICLGLLSFAGATFITCIPFILKKLRVISRFNPFFSLIHNHKLKFLSTTFTLLLMHSLATRQPTQTEKEFMRQCASYDDKLKQFEHFIKNLSLQK